MSQLGHDNFLRTISISGILKTIGRLHIGSGNYESTFEEAESILIRIKNDGLDLPYIPGSSLKGIFRSTTEHILNSIGEKPCFLQKNSNCVDISKLILEASKARNHLQVRNLIKNLCIACKIFGSQTFLSNVIFYDSVPLDRKTIEFDISPGIAINRRDATAMRGALFNIEHINPNSTFNFRFQIKNLPNIFVGILFKVIFLINKGIVLIGGKKRAGLGEIYITIDKLEIQGIEEDIIIDYDTINNIKLETIKINNLGIEEFSDIDIDIVTNNLKGKKKENFSEILINYFTKVWDDYVKDKNRKK